MLPLTVGGPRRSASLATAAGHDELAWWCWTIPAAIVGVWLVVSIIARPAHGARPAWTSSRSWRSAGPCCSGESLAAAVIAVMLATGDWLERYAAGRAHRELSALVSRAPRIVHRHEDGGIADRPIADVEVGDRLAGQARRGRARWTAT